jgi:sulfur relay (sulfurtransferase) complex TusBCD TusD component (DsrE family)
MAKFVYTLSKNDVNLATRCFQFAKMSHEKGHQVDIFFIEDGTLWADKTRDFTEKTIAGDRPQDYFPYLEENEIMIGV